MTALLITAAYVYSEVILNSVKGRRLIKANKDLLIELYSFILLMKLY